MRRPLIGLLVGLALVLGTSVLVWRWAVDQIRTQLAGWEATQRAVGWTIAHGVPEPGGWPLAAELALPELSIMGGADSIPGGVAWRGERVTLRVAARQPSVFEALIAGRQQLRVGSNQPIDLIAERCTLTAPLDPSGLSRSMALDAAGIRLASGLAIGLLQGQLDASDPAGTEFRITSEAITLPPTPAPQSPLGSHIASATVEGSLRGVWPAGADPAAAAAQWRAKGGAVEVRRLAIGWGPLGVSGGVSLSLDEALQPTGKADLRLVGYDATLSALAAGHILTPHAAQAAQAVLGLLATNPEGGGAPQVQVPLTLRDGTLSMGHIPLARIPQLVWPSPAQPASFIQ